MGYDHPHMIDCHAAPVFELINAWTSGVLGHIGDKLELTKRYPAMLEYVARFTSHPLIKPYHMRKAAIEKQAIRGLTWPKDEKCQLSVESLVFED